MNKVIVFSHESDIDGLGCIILGKIAFGDVDYVLLPGVVQLEKTFRSYIQTGKLNEYDYIFITDLALYNPALSIAALDENLKNKIFVFDHHKSSIDDGCNAYDFTKIIEVDENGHKRCGTDLFFEYLLKYNFIENNLNLSSFVEFTRLEDTWDWKHNGDFGLKAHELAILFNAIGKEQYIYRMTMKLRNDKTSDFIFSQDEIAIIETKKKEYENLLISILEDAEYFIDDMGNKFGIVFARYEYRNELVEFIRNSGNPHNIKYFIVVALDKGENGQKSYRSINDDFDVSEIAVIHGGGGHPAAASVNLTAKQKSRALVLKRKEGLKYLAAASYK